MSDAETRALLNGRVLVEEKMDGKPVVFGAGKYILFAEDMRKQHSIYYRLPGRYAVFDVYDQHRSVFLSLDEKLSVARKLRDGKIQVGDVPSVLFFPVPVVAIGSYNLSGLPQLCGMSAYAYNRKTGEPAIMEGIVVKPDRDLFLFEFVAGKIVMAEFEEGIATHHLRLPFQMNAIDPTNVNVIYPSFVVYPADSPVKLENNNPIRA